MVAARQEMCAILMKALELPGVERQL